MTAIVFVVLLLAQTANPWDGTWQWGTWEERRAATMQGRAEAAEIAREHCGEPYFGTICDPPAVQP